MTVADWIVPPRAVKVAGWLNGSTAAAAVIVGAAGALVADADVAAAVTAGVDVDVHAASPRTATDTTARTALVRRRAAQRRPVVARAAGRVHSDAA